MKRVLALFTVIALATMPAIAQRGRAAATPEGLRAIHAFGTCVAKNSPEKAGKVLQSDFRSATYRSTMLQLVRSNMDGCNSRDYQRMRASGLLGAGAMAEQLLESGAQPANVRLARAAGAPAVAGYSPSDTLAVCVVRAMPDEVAALFATEVASAAEDAAAAKLNAAVSRCASSTLKVEASVSGLRAMLATAGYRSVAAVEGAGT